MKDRGWAIGKPEFVRSGFRGGVAKRGRWEGRGGGEIMGEKGRGQMGWKDRVDFRRIRIDKMVRLRWSIIGLD